MKHFPTTPPKRIAPNGPNRTAHNFSTAVATVTTPRTERRRISIKGVRYNVIGTRGDRLVIVYCGLDYSHALDFTVQTLQAVQNKDGSFRLCGDRI